MNVIFIVPCFNASRNIDNLAQSLISQRDDRWSCILIDDMSDDDTYDKISGLPKNKFSIVKNKTKKFALRNIIENSRVFQDREDIVIAVIDGDDSLCNEYTVTHLLDHYERGDDVVWTAHRWDINGMNISKPMPKNVDPYSWPWCSSHLRTFKSSLLRDVTDKNFKDTSRAWFKRGYDQALMLPILHVSQSRNFLPEVCYQYNINSVSIKDRSWEEREQLSTINIVRARGFLK